MERIKKLGVIALAGGVIAVVAVTGLYIINGESRDQTATLGVLVWNDSWEENDLTERITVSIDSDKVIDDNFTLSGVIPSGYERYRIELEKGEHTVKAKVIERPGERAKAKIERKIKVTDENLWISVRYAGGNVIHFDKNEKGPHLIL